MKVYAHLRGGLGDMMLQMLMPGKPFGYLADCSRRGAETAVVVESDRPSAHELLAGATFVDHICQKPPRSFEPIGGVVKRNPSLRWAPHTIALTEIEQRTVETVRPGYVAVHFGGSTFPKRPPNPTLLMRLLRESKVPYVIVGHEGEGAAPPLRTHIAIVKRADAFIGSLSCFNVVAQLDKIPSFVLVNRALKEPTIYSLMADNGARVEPWNVGKPIEQIYAEAVEFARARVLSGRESK